MADSEPKCRACNKTQAQVPNLKRCAKCQTTYYCSRECQKKDWKEHKKVCSQQPGNAPPKTPPIESSATYASPKAKNLDIHIDKPFTRLDDNTYLHGRSEKDVSKLLIDALRMREADNANLEGKIDPNSVYDGASSSIEGFRKFMRLAATRANLLPPGWNSEKQKKCEELGLSNSDFSSLKRKVTKAQIIAHYGFDKMPMQLRMLAEAVYGVGPGGQSGAGMRTILMRMENGGGQDGLHMSLLQVK